MSWLDLLTVALFVVLAFVEARRGATPAAVDLVLSVIGVGVAKGTASQAGVHLGSEAAGFLAIFAAVVVGTGVVSWLVDAYTKWDIGPYDSAVAGVLGAITGLVLAHGAFHAALAAGGSLAEVAKGSALVSEVHGLRTLHALGDILRNLGGGKTITEKVREQQR